jgi:hypothetical protein
MARIAICRRICSVRPRIPFGVSSSTPLGAALKPGWIGLAEWQLVQREFTMARMREKSALPVSVADPVRGSLAGINARPTLVRISKPNAAGQTGTLPSASCAL